MKYDIILAGVGGQGVLSIAAIVGVAAVDSGLRMKQSEVHGMSQRGGEVQSHLRIADRQIFSDLIPAGRADMILSMEPLETLRYLPYLCAEGVIVAECNPLVNIPNYPPIGEVLSVLQAHPRATLIDGVGIARALRATRSSNMALLGAASTFLPLPVADLEQAIDKVFGRKGEAVVAQNIEAFRQGRAITTTAQVG